MKLLNGKICGDYFTNKWKRKRHQLSAAHSTDKPFKCGSCNKGFGRKDSRDRHERTLACEPVSCTEENGDKNNDQETGGKRGKASDTDDDETEVMIRMKVKATAKIGLPMNKLK